MQLRIKRRTAGLEDDQIVFEFGDETITLAEVLQFQLGKVDSACYGLSKEISNCLVEMQFQGIELNDIAQPIFYRDSKVSLLYALSVRDLIIKHKISEVIVKDTISHALHDVLREVCREYGISFFTIVIPGKTFFIVKNYLRTAFHLTKFILLSLASVFFARINHKTVRPRLFLTYGNYSFDKMLQSIIRASVESKTETIVFTASTGLKEIANEFVSINNNHLYTCGRARFLKPSDAFYVIWGYIYFKIKLKRCLQQNVSLHNENTWLLRMFLNQWTDLLILHLTLAQIHIRVATRVITKLNPRILVIADDASVWSHCFVKVGRKCGVPSLLVQHGLIEDPYLYVPRSDISCLWGSRSKELILGTGENTTSRMFITGSPLQFGFDIVEKENRAAVLIVLTLFHDFELEELESVLNGIICCAKDENQTLIIKPHPSDKNIELYDNIIHNNSARGICSVERGNVSNLARMSKLTILLAPSTAMLEIIMSGCPIISLRTGIFQRRSAKNWLDSILMLGKDTPSLNYYVKQSAEELKPMAVQQRVQLEAVVGLLDGGGHRRIFELIKQYEKNIQT